MPDRDKNGRYKRIGPELRDKVVRVTKQELKAIQEARAQNKPLAKVIKNDK